MRHDESSTVILYLSGALWRLCEGLWAPHAIIFMCPMNTGSREGADVKHHILIWPWYIHVCLSAVSQEKTTRRRIKLKEMMASELKILLNVNHSTVKNKRLSDTWGTPPTEGQIWYQRSEITASYSNNSRKHSTAIH